MHHTSRPHSEGGYSKVFKARWLGVTVAVKLFESGASNPRLKSELENEVGV